LIFPMCHGRLVRPCLPFIQCWTACLRMGGSTSPFIVKYHQLHDQYHLRLEQRIILLAGQYHRVAQTIEKTDLLARGVGTLFTILLKLNTALDKYDQDPANYLLQEPQKPQPQSLVNTELTAQNLNQQKTEPKMNHPEVSSPSSTEHFSVSSESDLLNYIDDYFGKYRTYPPEQEIKKLRQTLDKLDRHEAKINRQAS
jgi:hypothetical protein